MSQSLERSFAGMALTNRDVAAELGRFKPCTSSELSKLHSDRHAPISDVSYQDAQNRRSECEVRRQASGHGEWDRNNFEARFERLERENCQIKCHIARIGRRTGYLKSRFRHLDTKIHGLQQQAAVTYNYFKYTRAASAMFASTRQDVTGPPRAGGWANHRKSSSNRLRARPMRRGTRVERRR